MIKILCFEEEEEEATEFLKNQLQSKSKDIDVLAAHMQSFPLVCLLRTERAKRAECATFGI